MNDTHSSVEPTRIIELFMAGDIEHAKQIVRRFCRDNPCCVTVSHASYIYTGGEESGFVVGFRNYPRFPSGWKHLTDLAESLAKSLVCELGQHSHMIVEHAGVTTWETTRKEAS